MPDRTLKKLPLVEYVFEVRWGTNEGATLHEEYQLALGKLHERIQKTGFSIRQRIVDLPRELYGATPPVRGVVFDRFLHKPPDGDKLSYPLKQYGPGIASYNVDGLTYKWDTVKAEVVQYYQELKECHVNFEERIDAVTLRSIDLFPVSPPEARALLTKRLKITASSSIDDLPSLGGSMSLPSYRCEWTLPGSSTKLKVLAHHAQAFGQPGIVLDIVCTSSGEDVRRTTIEDVLATQHKLAGDAFFALLSEELYNELHNGG